MRDQAGAPIANAQVFIVGTAFNALTNPQGYYFINNVPAGTISVRAAFIGYKSTQVDGVKVLAGQTGTVDIQLEQTAVEIQEITVVSQTQPLVPRDEVTTKQRVDGDVAEEPPGRPAQPGPGASAGRHRVDTNGNPVRSVAAATTQNATYVDGVPIQAGYRGDSVRRLRCGSSINDRHRRVRGGLGHDRVDLGRVRQRASRASSRSSPGPAAPSTTGRWPTRPTSRSA